MLDFELLELELPALEVPELELPVLELREGEPLECELPVELGEGTLAGTHVPVLVLADELAELAVLCVEPGSTAATAPAASTLANPTVAVAVFSLRRPRSRSAMARETCRAAAWPRVAPSRWSQLSIIAVWHA